MHPSVRCGRRRSNRITVMGCVKKARKSCSSPPARRSRREVAEAGLPRKCWSGVCVRSKERSSRAPPHASWQRRAIGEARVTVNQPHVGPRVGRGIVVAPVVVQHPTVPSRPPPPSAGSSDCARRGPWVSGRPRLAPTTSPGVGRQGERRVRRPSGRRSCQTAYSARCRGPPHCSRCHR